MVPSKNSPQPEHGETLGMVPKISLGHLIDIILLAGSWVFQFDCDRSSISMRPLDGGARQSCEPSTRRGPKEFPLGWAKKPNHLMGQVIALTPYIIPHFPA